MSDEVFKLGRSSFEEVKNIIRGYAHFERDVKLDDLARLLAVNKAIVSGNNGFLAEVGLIEGGKTKGITPLGRNLGRAIEHNREEDIKKYLREAVQGNKFLSDMVSTVRIREGMAVEDFASHILYASGQPNTNLNATGARSVVDLLNQAFLLRAMVSFMWQHLRMNNRNLLFHPRKQNQLITLHFPRLRIPAPRYR